MSTRTRVWLGGLTVALSMTPLPAFHLLDTGSASAATVRASCTDIGYLNAAVKSGKKKVAALKLAGQSRYSAALAPAQTSLWFIKHSPQPCDEGTEDYWLHRQYSIRYAVALVRYLEEEIQRDYDAADTYWSSVEFWGDEIRDIQLAW